MIDSVLAPRQLRVRRLDHSVLRSPTGTHAVRFVILEYTCDSAHCPVRSADSRQETQTHMGLSVLYSYGIHQNFTGARWLLRVAPSPSASPTKVVQARPLSAPKLRLHALRGGKRDVAWPQAVLSSGVFNGASRRNLKFLLADICKPVASLQRDRFGIAAELLQGLSDHSLQVSRGRRQASSGRPPMTWGSLVRVVFAARRGADGRNLLAAFRLESEMIDYLKCVYCSSKRIAKDVADEATSRTSTAPPNQLSKWLLGEMAFCGSTAVGV